MSIKRKTLDQLSKEEINSIISNSRTYGFMKYVMKNLKNKTIENPKNIILFYKNRGIDIVSWLLLDEGKELCKSLEEPEVSIMLYTAYRFRKMGLMNELIEFAKPQLKNKTLKVYADPWELDYIYILKLGAKYDLTFQSHVTSYDLKPILNKNEI